MFDFPKTLKTIEDVPETYQVLYRQTEEGFTLSEELAARLKAPETDQQLADLQAEKESLSGELSAYREIAQTPDEVTSRLADLERATDRYLMDQVAGDAISRKGGQPRLLMPHLMSLLEVRAVAGERQVAVRQDHGLKGSDGADAPISNVEEAVGFLASQPEFAVAFQGTAHSETAPLGGGMSPQGNRSVSGRLTAGDQTAVNSKIEDIAAGRITVTL